MIGCYVLLALFILACVYFLTRLIKWSREYDKKLYQIRRDTLRNNTRNIIRYDKEWEQNRRQNICGKV